MKIIAIADQRWGTKRTFICEVSTEEIDRLLGEFYGSGRGEKMGIGDEIKIVEMSNHCRAMRETKVGLLSAPKTLRALADILDRECVAIVSPPEPTPAKE